jgi:DNA-binding transcriptional LysR family regulator
MSFLPRRNGEAEGRGEESWVWLHRLSSASLRCLRFSAVNLHRPGLRLMNEFLTTEKRRNGGTRRRILSLASPAVLCVSPLPPLLRGQSSSAGASLDNEFLTTEKRRSGGTRRRILCLASPAVLCVSPLPPLLRGESSSAGASLDE